MDKKSNMKQAMYEMFGVGSMPAAEPAEPAREEAVKQEPLPVLKEPPKAPAEPEKAPVVQPESKPKAAVSYLAPGTVMEGTLRAVGDVEIAGDFKGDITTEGTVILHSNIQGNLSVSSLNLSGCSLVGDVVASGMVTVSADSKICGNVTAKELCCAGKIVGDSNISGTMVLGNMAQIDGNIRAGSMSVEKGAMMKGTIEIKAFK